MNQTDDHDVLTAGDPSFELAEWAGQSGSWRVDVETGRLTSSPGLRRILGRELGEAPIRLTEALQTLLHPDERGMVSDAKEALLGRGSSWSGECRLLHADGPWRWVQAEVAPQKDDRGRVTTLIGFVRDITAQKEAQRARELSEAKFATAFQTSPDAVNINRLADGLYVDINQGFTRLTGYTADDVAGKTSADIAIWADQADRAALVGGLINQGAVHNLEARFRRKDGSETTALMSAQIIDIESERCILSVTRDISNRKAAENALRESEALHRSILNASPDDISITDLDGRILMVSPAAFEMFALTEDDQVLGHHLTDFVVPEDRERAANSVGLMFEGIMTGPGRYRGLRFDGSTFDMEVNAEFIRDAAGEPHRIVFIVRDVSERSRLEEAVQKRLVALTQPLATTGGLTFSDLFDIDEIQSIQDAFSSATGVASIITDPSGTPITKPSNFCRLCSDIIRQTELGRANCFKSDAALGRRTMAGAVHTCLSGGFWDAGARISAGGEHVANWLIGQVRNEQQDDELVLAYADEIGADREEFAAALAEVPTMKLEQFERIAQALAAFANELSVVAYQNVQQARFITEQQRVESEIRALNVDLERRDDERTTLLDRLAETLTSIIDVIGNLSEMRDPYTAGHQRRVAELATEIATEMGMSDAEVADIKVAGLMHDIGKISVPAEILSRPSALSPAEFSLVRGHAQAGYDIISSAKMQGPISELVYQHHERCDGSGYPRGLSSDDILAGSKVLMVADVVEAMMSHRPYRPALGMEAALTEIAAGAGTLYDPRVAASCEQVLRERGFDFSEA